MNSLSWVLLPFISTHYVSKSKPALKTIIGFRVHEWRQQHPSKYGHCGGKSDIVEEGFCLPLFAYFAQLLAVHCYRSNGKNVRCIENLLFFSLFYMFYVNEIVIL